MPTRLPAQYALRGSRLRLFLTGLFVLGLGLAAIVSEYVLESAVLVVVGAALLAAAAAMLGQWLWGRLARGTQPTRGLLAVVTQAGFNVVAGSLLIQHREFAFPVLSALVGLLLLGEAVLQLGIARKMPPGISRAYLLTCGLLSGGVGLAAVFLCRSPLASLLLNDLLGLKLMLFGGALMLTAVCSQRDEDEEMVYGSYAATPGDRVPGELYAVTFGPAFHLGVYLGDDEVVDFHFNNQVTHVAWEQFAAGHQPQRWEYPDVAAAPADVVIAAARAQIGRQYKYKAVTFNCENFAIFCKSGGRQITSRFAQAPMGLALVARYPLMGSLLESFGRLGNWIAYMLGGTLGRRAGLAVRRLSALVAGWLAPQRSAELLKHFETTPLLLNEPE